MECWFCGNEADGKELTKKMHKVLDSTTKSTGGGQETTTTYLKDTIDIPRCKSCQTKHRSKTIFNFVLFFVLLGLIIFSMVLKEMPELKIDSGIAGLVLAFHPENYMYSLPFDGNVVLILFILSLFAIPNILSFLVFKIFFFRKSKSKFAIDEYPEVAQALKDGWKFGKDPSNIFGRFF